MSAERTWTGNSEVDAAIVMLDRIDCSPEDDSRVDEVESTLRRLHARIQELEAMLESIGASGVSAQRVTQEDGHIAQEPAGWRYQTSTGWHATTDASAALRVSKHHAIEPMYTAPQPQADARDAERWSEIGKSIERACAELPEGVEISISLEHHAGAVTLIDSNGNEDDYFDHECGLAGTINQAIAAAIAEAEGMRHER